MIWILLAIWLAFAVAAFALFADGWRQHYDVERRDVVLFSFLSLAGPASLLAAGIIWLLERDWGPSPIIWRRK